MNFTNREKQLLLGNAPVLSRITLYAEDGTALQVFNENDYLVDWEYEDYRYVPDQGFIGQFVERLLDGHLMNIPDTLSLEDKEISVEIAVVDNELEEQVYHNYGRFIITKIEKEDTTGSYKFESSDYTKKFNEVYTGGVTFPCTALKLLNSACDQVGVGLDVTNNTQAIEYVVPKDGLQAGNYHFVVNETYYNFALSENLVEGNLLMLKGDKLILRKVTSDYNIIREELVYSTGETGTGTLLSDESYGYYELINDDFVVNDNQFTENNTCRDVVRSVAQLSYTWARINENNRLCLDFVKNDNVDSYDEIDTDKYYEATVTGDRVEPINKVLIGMSQVEGENIVKEQDNDLLGVDTIYGETSQETYTGKNLLNPFVTSQTFNGITSTYDEINQTITFNGTCTTDNSCFGFTKTGTIALDGTYTLSYEVLGGTISNTTTTTKIQIQQRSDWASISVPLRQTSASNTQTVTLSCTANNIRFDNGVVVNNYKIRIQLEKNSAKTSWEKYVGGIPSPNPDFPQDVNTVTGGNVFNVKGKNLFNISLYDNSDKTGQGTVSNNGDTITFTSANTDSYTPSMWSETQFYDHRKMAMPCEPNTTYTFSFDVDSTPNGCIYVYEGDKDFKGVKNNNPPIRYDNTTRIKTFTTSSNTHYLIFRIVLWVATTVNISNIQLEKGSSKTEYEPYQSQFYELDLGKNLFNKDNVNDFCGWIDGTTMRVKPTSATGENFFILPCEPSTTYTISKLAGTVFRVASGNFIPVAPSSGQTDYTNLNIVNNETGNTITYKTGTNHIYLYVEVWRYDTGVTEEEMLATVQVEKGSLATDYTPYHEPIELNKIGTYRDKIFKTMGKNLNKYPYSATGSGNGITFTASNDGIITLNGQNNGNGNSAYMFFNNSTNPMILEAGTYYIIPPSNTNIGYVMYDGTNYYNFSTNNRYSYTFSEPVSIRLFYIQVARGNTTTFTNEVAYPMLSKVPNQTIEDYEPYGSNNEWYLKKAIGKYTFTGASNENWYLSGANCIKCNALNTTLGYPLMNNIYNYSRRVTLGLYSNYGISGLAQDIVVNDTTSLIGLGAIDTGGGTTDAIYVSRNGQSVADFKTKLASNPIICYYVLNTPEVKKITYQPLIDQLNALQNAGLFEGINYITVNTLNEQPSLDITVTDLEQDSTSYSGKSFEITGHDYDKGGSIYIYDNPLTYTEALRRIAINGAENLFGLTYIPMEVNSIGHPWLTGKEFVRVTNLENQELYFYPFDRKISYTGVLTTDLSAQAKNEVAQKYENRNNVVDKINHTEIVVDKANGTIEALSKTVDDNKEEFTQWQSTEYNSLKSTVGEIDRDLNVGNDSIHSRLSSVEQTTTAITNMFQITGGINLIRNSAFLLTDEVWEFTNNGTNPYHTDLGVSYNSTLSGQTVSVAEIKARSIKIKSKSENITNLKIDTKYTFNFYHQQDNNMTTTIKMYSTENNSSKAFNDIVITGQQEFKNYEVSFTPTTYTNYTIEIIVTSTSSVGYAYIYDMMLNAGDKQAWQPASDEIYSTTLQMSRLGLKVYSVGDGTITLLGSDGMSTWETSDGVTLGRLVSMRTEAGDRVKTVTTEALYLTKDIRQENANRWVETIVTISGTPYKVEYIESGGQ